MESLPIEIMLQVLSYALVVHPRPSSILCVNTSWRDASQPILHSRIRLKTLTQLYLFGTSARLCRAPKSFALLLPGAADSPINNGRTGAVAGVVRPAENLRYEDQKQTILTKVIDNGGIWGCLERALILCPTVDRVYLRLHSYINDPNLGLLFKAFCVIKYVDCCASRQKLTYLL
jgi:hypothetical protein